ncbi:hypothetical protein IEE83_09045 [Dyadobacter sp. UP-52]|uniref:Uncharacterized protein n=2 Tax=Dyadobacter subterraneus TaxID=2773304 RepID=A0ABR9W976_9BACT|nr:hypothetical protein [Dyadobacter subterraneus]
MEVTPWVGMVFLRQILDKMGFREHIKSRNCLAAQHSKRGYEVSVI